ncbi:MAG: tetraacyldisaccharide 4'-kinase [Burkholderiales bacterium]|nr:tetraacyldisaccharide 4'-kinase [Burkholderiales bacterium]
MALTSLLERRRTALEQRLLARWFPAMTPPGGTGSAGALWPLAWLTGFIAGRRRRQIRRLDRAHRPAVIVVGNLVVGGSGKTPLVAQIARHLSDQGWRVGILTRGHRAALRQARLVGPDDDPARHGDEPVMLARITRLPVGCGIDRGAALALLLAAHPGLEVIVSDDGLQHPGLARTLELAVFDERGAGNGRLLPAGPLREPLVHLRDMDAVLLREPGGAATGLSLQRRTRPVSSAARRRAGAVAGRVPGDGRRTPDSRTGRHRQPAALFQDAGRLRNRGSRPALPVGSRPGLARSAARRCRPDRHDGQGRRKIQAAGR